MLKIISHLFWFEFDHQLISARSRSCSLLNNDPWLKRLRDAPLCSGSGNGAVVVDGVGESTWLRPVSRHVLHLNIKYVETYCVGFYILEMVNHMLIKLTICAFCLKALLHT